MSLTRDIHDLTDTEEVHDLYGELQGTVAFDIGASGGKVAGLLAPNFEWVIACEPSVEPYEVLRDNASPNVIALNVAASDLNGVVELQVREMSEQRGYLFSGDSLPEWGNQTGTVEVPSRTLDSLAHSYGFPDFVKIDTEGHEIPVLRGARRTFDAHPTFLIEIHSEADGVEAFMWLEARGLEARVIRHASHKTGSYRWHNHHWLTNHGVE